MTLIRDNSLLRQWQGPLTQDIILEPGKFGLGKVPSKVVPTATVSSVCGFCATGCSLNVHMNGDKAINLSTTDDYPVNVGMACPKGWEALSVLEAKDRATTPYIRDEASGKLQPADWDTALTLFCDKFKAVQDKHGKESVAFLSTGQLVTEEKALLGSLAKFGMGMLHGDGNTRQCMATAVVAYKQSFGFDSPPYTYQDFEESDTLVFVGANPCIAHPIMWQRVMRNKRKPNIVVIDPRKTETAVAATLHLPIKPKSDLVLLYTLANMLIQRGAIDERFIVEHTNQFEEFKAFVSDYTLEKAVEATGLSVEQIERLASITGPDRRVSYWWTMGVNQSHEGTRTAQAMINLALMTGNIGKPGTGANSITGQCNAMGSRMFSNTTALLAGHDFTDAVHRQRVADRLGIDASLIPDQQSWDYARILEGVERGEIKGLWFIATNPAHSWINQKSFHKLREKLEFLVVQDMYVSTETAALADLVLPAAGWGEKDGTFINSERRFGVTRKVAKAPGQALADFYIFKLIAEYWGCADLFAEWDTPEDAFKILARVSEGQPCDISGISGYSMLDEFGGIQWPCPSPEVAQTTQRRLFTDKKFYHADGKAKFCFEESRKHPELPSEEYPFVLLTGRGTSAQWHTQTRTSKSEVLQRLYPKDCYVEISPCDAEALGIDSHTQVRITSLRASIVATAFITTSVKKGEVFLPMHYPEVNKLTYPIFDPYSKQPGYKYCAVAIGKA